MYKYIYKMTDFFELPSKLDKKINRNESFLFVLKNINLIDIDKQYNMELISNTGSTNTYTQPLKKSSDFTPIDKIGIKDLKQKPISTFINKDKVKSLIYVTFGRSIDVDFCKLKCHGCHRYFDTYPLGIPINYEHKLNKEHYTLDSCVCSFNCMYLVLESSWSPLYKNSSFLINKLYHTLYGEYPKQKIIKAPNWRLQKCYGGPLDPIEYSNCFQSISFDDLHTIHKFESSTQHCGRTFDIKSVA